MNIYDIRRYGKVVFLIVTVVVVGIFLRISSDLVNDLAGQERERMQIWADATKKIAGISMETDADGFASQTDDIEFLLGIISGNNTIPVLLVDDKDNILEHRNFDLPEAIDLLNPFAISPRNEKYLKEKLEKLRGSSHVIEIAITEEITQYLYYDDSQLLKRLSIFPYLQLFVMLAFIFVVYYAVTSTKRAEQNKVWVGLSKETAHQLGTPISSLVGWIEYLGSTGLDPEVVKEMNKDVTRLSTIASRFSKIGSKPTLEPSDLNEVVSSAVGYMSTRISSRIALTAVPSATDAQVNLSRPLMEWVMENLIKNAVDAMGDHGAITVTVNTDDHNAIIDVTDTGKGISAKHRKTIFNPGYTTKKRGWGLGLTLAKRIIEQYHAGRIFVLRSEPGHGTTFRIILPLVK